MLILSINGTLCVKNAEEKLEIGGKLELFCRMLHHTKTAVLMPFYWMLNNDNNKGNFYHLPHKVGA